MKIFIVYASAGAGHFKAAEAVYNHIKNTCNQIDVKLVDILEKANPVFRFNYNWGYSHLITNMPLVWQFAFWLTSNRSLRFLTRPVASVINKLNTKEFAKVLIHENPDCIISTHFLPSEIVAYLKKDKRITSKLVTVITDFQVHPFWIEPETDIYVVASDFTKKLLIFEGVEETKIKEFGIPIDAKFLQKFNRQTLCERFGISQNKFTTLIVTGSYGIGPIEEIVDLLHKDTQILVICARNKKLYKRLKTKGYPNVKLFGFVDNIQELMAVSDLIVTKPGGLSISELLSMELVPVFISAIPGQETANIEALKNYGVGIKAKDILDLKKIIFDYKDNVEKLNSAKEKIKTVKKPFAAEELCDAICKGSLWTTC